MVAPNLDITFNQIGIDFERLAVKNGWRPKTKQKTGLAAHLICREFHDLAQAETEEISANVCQSNIKDIAERWGQIDKMLRPILKKASSLSHSNDHFEVLVSDELMRRLDKAAVAFLRHMDGREPVKDMAMILPSEPKTINLYLAIILPTIQDAVEECLIQINSLEEEKEGKHLKTKLLAGFDDLTAKVLEATHLEHLTAPSQTSDTTHRQSSVHHRGSQPVGHRQHHDRRACILA